MGVYASDSSDPAARLAREKAQRNIRAARPDAPPGAVSAHFILVNDSSKLHEDALAIEYALIKRGAHFKFTCFSSRVQLACFLHEKRDEANPPEAFFLDAGGVGHEAGQDIIAWMEKNHPGKKLPAIHFLSLNTHSGIDEASELRHIDARLASSASSSGELTWLRDYLEGRHGPQYPGTAALRATLNDALNLQLPVDTNQDYADLLEKLNDFTNKSVFAAWQKGELSAREAITRLRPFLEGVIETFRSGLYSRSRLAGDTPMDATFYQSAGFPVHGRAVFSAQEAVDAFDKPVLIMQRYDPAVVPILTEGTIGGLVVTSPYMASHLRMLCEARLVPGLFGLRASGEQDISSQFLEETRPDLPAFFAGDEIEIAGRTVRRGQKVIAGLRHNGLVVDPDAVAGIMEEAARQPGTGPPGPQQQRDLQTVRDMGACFAAFFKAEDMPAHRVKMNIATYRDLNDIHAGIGLVRTEQAAAADMMSLAYIQDYMLSGGQTPRDALLDNQAVFYRSLVGKLGQGAPVRIRLFDFVPREILKADQHKGFLQRYGTLDIHGGDALAAWPDLYRGQAGRIITALKEQNEYALHPDLPLDIMMPAVKTEEDVLAAKKIVDDAAAECGVPPGRYRFGVMIETLKSCRNIAAIAPHCDFVSFGTNDLTAEFFTISRGDLPRQAQFAQARGFNPFVKLAPGVLDLIRDTVARARAAHPGLPIDVCGAQAADAALALFDAGIDDISVAPTPLNQNVLPAQINYRLYDRVTGNKPSAPAAGSTARPS